MCFPCLPPSSFHYKASSPDPATARHMVLGQCLLVRVDTGQSGSLLSMSARELPACRGDCLDLWYVPQTKISKRGSMVADIHLAIGVKPGRRKRHLFLTGLPVEDTFSDCSAHLRCLVLITGGRCVPTCSHTPPQVMLASLRQGPLPRRMSHTGKQYIHILPPMGISTRALNVY